ncbi:hypothetical protein ACIQAL_21985 [Pseudomonas sp. NPDC088368]|uniref:hypothetical protein n=1 Tax=Pseudomonas sp. NPDC088368 TaxID=3364453 RepID=UPI003808D953
MTLMFFGTLTVAAGLTLLIDQLFGDFEHFKVWQASHYIYLLGWRITVYAVLAGLWLRVRRRISARSGAGQLIRCELLLALLVCLFEINHAGLLTGEVSS